MCLFVVDWVVVVVLDVFVVDWYDVLVYYLWVNCVLVFVVWLGYVMLWYLVGCCFVGFEYFFDLWCLDWV